MSSTVDLAQRTGLLFYHEDLTAYASSHDQRGEPPTIHEESGTEQGQRVRSRPAIHQFRQSRRPNVHECDAMSADESANTLLEIQSGRRGDFMLSVEHAPLAGSTFADGDQTPEARSMRNEQSPPGLLDHRRR